MKLTLSDTSYAAGVFDSAYTFPDIKVTEKRKVTCFELEIFSENGGVTYINDEGYQIRKGAVLFARPGDTRYTELPLRAYYVKIDAQCGFSAMFEKLQHFFIGSETEDIVYTVKELLAVPEAEPLRRLSLLLSVIYRILEENEKSLRLCQIPVQKSREAVGLGIEYMEKHFREKCTLKDIAAFAHFSPIYFHGIFKLATGKTPYEYLSAIRIKEAKRMLMTESADMTEIAERCGFSSQSYFNYTFKKATFLTPSAYRKKMTDLYLSENGRFE